MRRWGRSILRVVALAGAVVLSIEATRLGLDYDRDKSHADRATYVGALLGIVAILPFLAGFFRRPERPTLIQKLRTEQARDIGRRLRHLRLTPDEIDLQFVSNRTGGALGLDAFIDATVHATRFRVAVVGPAGAGKSYTALTLAEAVLADQSVIPVVVPLSRWQRGAEITEFLVDFLHDELTLSKPSARTLVEMDEVVPVFDGLDEISDAALHAEVLPEFFEALQTWRVAGGLGRCFVSVRDSAWGDLPKHVRARNTLDLYKLSPVGRPAAARFLDSSIRRDHAPGLADAVVDALHLAGRASDYERPARLAMVAKILVGLTSDKSLRFDPDTFVRGLDDDGLHETFVRSTLAAERLLHQRLLNAAAVRELARLAAYLRGNTGREIDHRPLPEHDLALQLLWPAAGTRKPRVVDTLLALVMSGPGLAWLGYFLSGRGLFGQVVFGPIVVIWLAMLWRTGMRPWVPAAVPNLSRLRQPRFFLPQLGAAAAIGLLAWPIVNLRFALVLFVSAWFAIGFSVGFGQTLTTHDTRVGVVGPEGVLRREHGVSRIAAGVAFPCLALGFTNTWGAWIGVPLAFGYCWLVGETVASALWRRYLALCLCRLRAVVTPARALRRAYRLGFVRHAGLSYQFREDELADYFADRSVEGLGHWWVQVGRGGLTHTRRAS